MERKARKQKSLARYHWFTMKMYLKNKEVEKGRENLTESIYKKLDEFAGPSSLKVMEKTQFNVSVRVLKSISSHAFDPFRNFVRNNDIPETFEQIASHSAFRVLGNIKITPAIDVLAQQASENIRPIYISHKPKIKHRKLEDKVNNIIAPVINHMQLQVPLPDLDAQAEPLINLSSTRRTMNHAEDEEFAIAQIAANAVGGDSFLDKSFNHIFAAKQSMRPLLRIAYPTRDTDSKHNPARTVTITGEYLTQAESLVSRSMQPIDDLGFPLYVFDLSVLKKRLGIDTDNVYKRINELSKLELEEENARQRQAIIRSRGAPLGQEDISESLDFIDFELHDGLRNFTTEILGLNDAVEGAVNFTKDLSSKTLKQSVTSTVFSQINILTPFLFGAANIKLHNIDERRAEEELLAKSTR